MQWNLGPRYGENWGGVDSIWRDTEALVCHLWQLYRKRRQSVDELRCRFTALEEEKSSQRLCRHVSDLYDFVLQEQIISGNLERCRHGEDSWKYDASSEVFLNIFEAVGNLVLSVWYIFLFETNFKWLQKNKIVQLSAN